ncbi:MAG: succinate dehydrogenase, cytochrome b556 subunit [Pseudomonadota bacterium]
MTNVYRPADRPLSPHLQSWGWTVTMASSITHRATGIALYGGTLLLLLWVWSLALGEEAFTFVAGIMGSPFGVVVFAGYAFAIVQHMFGGWKHFQWDLGYGLDYELAKKTAWAIYAASAVITFGLLIAGLNAKGA